MAGAEEIRQVFTTGGRTIAKFNTSSTNLSPASNILVASSKQDLIKIYDTQDDTKEPSIVDTMPDTTVLLPLSDSKKFVVAGKDGQVKIFSSKMKDGVVTLHRSLLPIRSVVLSHDERKVVISGDDNEVCIVDLEDRDSNVKFPVDDQVHGSSYSLKLNLLALSLSNGDVKIYDCMNNLPKCIQTISGEISKLIYQDHDEEEEDNDEDNLLTSTITWSPSTEEFALPSSSKLIKVFKRDSSGEFQPSHSFPSLHQDKLVDLQYDRTGSFLASLDIKGKLIIWDTVAREAKYEKQFGEQRKLRNLCWGNGSTSDSLSMICGAGEGQILMLKDIVTVSNSIKSNRVMSEMEEILAMEQEASEKEEEEDADDIHFDSELSGDENDRGEDLNGFINDGKDDDEPIDGYGLSSQAIDHEDEEEGLFVDSTRKRKTANNSNSAKRSRSNIYTSSTSNTNFTNISQEFTHTPFSQGCTPFGSSNKRFLTMNAVGHVYTVKHEDQSSISVAFFDQSENRGYHFEDYDNFDLAALSSEGLFLGVSNKHVVITRKTRDDEDDLLEDEEEEEQKTGEQVSSYEGIISYRSHSRDVADQWTKRIPLSSSEEMITTIALSSNMCLVGTSLGYLRYFSIEGIPLHYERTLPVVASAVNDTHILTIMLQNEKSFVYSVFTMDRMCLQRELAIPISVSTATFTSNIMSLIKTVFFSTHGTPVIVTNDNVVLCLADYSQALQAHWTPVLNCTNAINEMNSGKQIKGIYSWPLGLHYDEVMCLVGRNIDEYPVAPLPLPDTLHAKLEISLPDSKSKEIVENEETLLKSRVFGEFLSSSLSQHGELYETDQEQLQHYTTSIERSVLVLYSKACSEGETKRAWALVLYLRELNTIRLALKMAERVDNSSLIKKIQKLIEAKETEELEQDEANIFSD